MKINLSMRIKILLAVMVMVSTVVSVITFTMANLFHEDKRTYIYDMISMVAVQTAQEANSVLGGYREGIDVFGRVVYDASLSQKQKTGLVKQMFGDFKEFIAITFYDPRMGQGSIYDANQLEAAGLSRETLDKYRAEHPLPLDRIKAGEVYIENSTVSERLPTLTIATAGPSSPGSAPAVIAATIRLEKLLKIAARSKVLDIIIVDNQGIVLAHADRQRVAQRAKADWIPDLENLQFQQSLGVTKEYRYNDEDVIGGFAPLGLGGLVAGVQLPKSAIYLGSRDLLQSLVRIALGLLILSVVLGLLWSYRLTRPIKRLSEAAEVVSKGGFDIAVQASSSDEIGRLADSFNQMVAELKTRALALEDANRALVQSEKMAAFGQLGAGIAHEVKNPLAGILGYAQLSLRKIDESHPAHSNLLRIEKETKRCRDIIENLMKFARQDKVKLIPTSINEVVENAIGIVDHQLSLNSIKIERSLAENLPLFRGDGNQIQQVLMNFMINAQQAMAGKPGQVTVATKLADPAHVEVSVTDNGPGMTEEVRAKIFEPFYTTKPVGQGTGLGLSVVYGIIKDHNGEIKVESEPGEYTTFTVILPVADIDGVEEGGAQVEDSAPSSDKQLIVKANIEEG